MESETKFGKACLVFQNSKFSLRYEGKKFKTWVCTTRKCNAPSDSNIPVTFVTMFLRHTSNLKIPAVLNRNWARMPDDGQMPTTTNGAEAFHRHLKSCFKTAHPNIFVLSTELLALQEETYTKLRSVDCSRSQRSATAKRHEQINDTCSKFRSGQS